MKEIIEVQHAFVMDSNRSPIMMVTGDGKRTCSVERVIKEAIGKHLNILTNRQRGSFRYPKKAIRVDGYRVDEVLPHAKRLRITVEVA